MTHPQKISVDIACVLIRAPRLPREDAIRRISRYIRYHTADQFATMGALARGYDDGAHHPRAVELLTAIRTAVKTDDIASLDLSDNPVGENPKET